MYNIDSIFSDKAIIGFTKHVVVNEESPSVKFGTVHSLSFLLLLRGLFLASQRK